MSSNCVAWAAPAIYGRRSSSRSSLGAGDGQREWSAGNGQTVRVALDTVGASEASGVADAEPDVVSAGARKNGNGNASVMVPVRPPTLVPPKSWPTTLSSTSYTMIEYPLTGAIWAETWAMRLMSGPLEICCWVIVSLDSEADVALARCRVGHVGDRQTGIGSSVI